MALTKIKTGGITDNAVTDAKVADAITVTGAQTGITQVGTLTAGTWNGTAIASAYLDADTAHLSGTQTFSGAKTFTANPIIQSDTGTLNFYNAAGTQRAFLQLSSTGLIIDTDSFLEFKPNNTRALYIDSSLNSTFAGSITTTSAGTANAPSLAIDNPSSSAYIHALEAFGANMTQGQIHIFCLGKEGSTKNTSVLGYKWDSAGSDNNLLTFEHWGTGPLMVMNGAGNVAIGHTSTADTDKLYITDGASPYGGANRMIQVKRNATNGSGNDASAFASMLFGNNSNGFTIGYGGTTDRFRFVDGGAVERFTIVNGGNVGIGCTNPANKMNIQVSTDHRIGFWGDTDYSAIQSVNDANSVLKKLRFDASEYHIMNGNVGIGTTNTNNLINIPTVHYTNSASPDQGIRVHNPDSTADSVFQPIENADYVDWYWGSNTYFATNASYARYDTGKGTASIFLSGANHAIFMQTGDTGESPQTRVRIEENGYVTVGGGTTNNVNLTVNGTSGSARVVPQTDDTGYLGESNHRWQAVYATNGTVQTSDKNLKTSITSTDLGLDFVNKLNPVSYKWKVGGYDIKEGVGKANEDTGDFEEIGREEKPVAGKRKHYGLIAQEVKEVLGNNDFGGWVKEDLEDDGSLESLRYDQFIAPLIKAVQELSAKVTALENA